MGNSAKKMRRVCGILGIVGLLSAGSAWAENIGFSLSSADVVPGTKDLLVSVQDEGTSAPIAGASVSVVSLADFQTGDLHSALSTGADGSALLTGAYNAQPKAVTVSKQGYTTISVVGAATPKVSIFLKRLPDSSQSVVANGIVSGWQTWIRPRPRGPVYLGLVIRTLTVSDLLHFDMNSVISPLKDTIEANGPREIPSNIVFPPQDIFFGTVHLDKPNYRLPLEKNREATLAAVQADVAQGDLLGMIQNKPTPEALNKFRFSRFGLSSILKPESDVKADIVANVNLTPYYKVTVKKPPFASDVVVAALTDLNGERNGLIPTDLKCAYTSTQTTPTGPPTSLMVPKQAVGKSREVAVIAMVDSGRVLSGMILDQPPQTLKTGDYLMAQSLNDVPVIPASIPIQAPQKGMGSTVFVNQDRDEKESQPYPTWHVYSLPAAGKINVPTGRVAGDRDLRLYSVMQLEFDAAFDEKAIDGKKVLSKLHRFADSTALIKKPGSPN